MGKRKKPVDGTKTAGASHQAEIDLDDESLYSNRELSWLEFNRRVLEEATDPVHPLLERLKFLGIFATNLDEFFMIRVAGLKEQIYSGVAEPFPDGLSPLEQVKEIRSQLLPLYQWQSDIYRNDIVPALKREGIVFHTFHDLTSEEKKHFAHDFVDNIMPVLTPLALDPGHPFPRLLNRSLNIAFVLIDDVEGDEEIRIAVMQLPSALPRLVKLSRTGGHHFIPLEEVIRAQGESLFPGLRLRESHVFRVTRDAEVDIAEDEANDLITAVAEGIRQRRWGTDPVRMEVGPDMPRMLQQSLMKSLDLDPVDIYSLHLPLNVQDYLTLMQLDKRKLKDPPLTSRIPPEFTQEGVSIFDVLKEGDIMVQHPFDSFTNSVVRFMQQGADDPNVLAMKITLYRAGGSSPVIEALKRAASNGKNVTAFVELKARFDEENNIQWARELEQAGVHVVYGLMGLKTHCKVCLVVRKEGKNVLTYAHVSTGNYNLTTSRVYTDIGIFTGRQEFERDFVHLFNLLTGYSKYKGWQHIGVAPVNLRDRFIELIRREAKHQEGGKKGHIVAKLNAITDPVIMHELYLASMAGVKIELIIRGVCALRPGIKGVSETITVRSILDRFLEHSRIFWFRNDGEEEVFISSADWMTRNMIRRVELLFPVYDPKLKKRLRDILKVYLSDNVKARELTADGQYVRVPTSEATPIRAQGGFLEAAKKK